MKYILGFLLFLSAIGLSIYGFKSHIEKQKEYIKRALTTPPNLSIETILGKNLPTQKIVDDDSLLGIDNNHNEIRDDIELKIFAAFKTPIQRAIFLQSFRAEQRMLTDPYLIKNAKIWAKATDEVLGCIGYLHEYKNIPLNKKVANTILSWRYNNEKRVSKYFEYDQALSGGVYSIPKSWSQYCQFDVEAVLKLEENQSY